MRQTKQVVDGSWGVKCGKDGRNKAGVDLIVVFPGLSH